MLRFRCGYECSTRVSNKGALSPHILRPGRRAAGGDRCRQRRHPGGICLAGWHPLAYLTDDAIYQVHVDHLGTPQVLTDATGAIAWEAHYRPFGEAITSGSLTFNLRFPGQYHDAETGLHYNWHRYYDPQTGRYLTSDPIGLMGGLNPYAYAHGNPIANADPTGLWVGMVRQ